MHAGAGGLLLLRAIVKIPMRAIPGALFYAFSCVEVIRNGFASADSLAVVLGDFTMSVSTNPRLIAAYRDYMEVRKQARQGLLGSGAVGVYRERLREVYRLVSGK